MATDETSDVDVPEIGFQICTNYKVIMISYEIVYCADQSNIFMSWTIEAKCYIVLLYKYINTYYYCLAHYATGRQKKENIF